MILHHVYRPSEPTGDKANEQACRSAGEHRRTAVADGQAARRCRRPAAQGTNLGAMSAEGVGTVAFVGQQILGARAEVSSSGSAFTSDAAGS
jgi:hypothetical protein